jgi:hypothetical protein
MAKTHGAAGAAMTEAPHQGDPLEEQVSRSMYALDRGERPGVNDASGATDDAIAQRAYELYLARGGTHGADMDDWLQAERELRGERQQLSGRPTD